MSKKTRPNIIIHAPEGETSMRLIQEATDELYVKIISDELAKADLTYDEKIEVLNRLAAKLDGR